MMALSSWRGPFRLVTAVVRRTAWRPLILATLSLFAVTPALSQNPPDPFASARAAEARVGAVVERLALANRALCPVHAPALGLVLHTLDQYAPTERAEVAAAVGLAGPPAVFALVPGGAAGRAGVAVDDAIVRADGAPLPAASTGPARFTTTAAAQDALEGAGVDGTVTLLLRSPSGAERRVTLNPPLACRVRPIVTEDTDARASTDGLNLKISRGLLHQLPDDQLAAVLAHEFAHTVLAHPAAIRARGGKGGLFAAFNKRGRFVRRTEEAADRLSVVLLANAGFDPAAAVAFWRGWGRDHQALFGDSSHGGWDDRVAVLQAEIDDLPPPAAAPISGAKETGDGE